jgi:hypothetical protein
MTKPHGNKRIATKEEKEKVVSMYSEGKQVSEIAREIGVSMDTLQKWKLEDPLFGSECSRAQELGFEVMADSLLSICETYEDVNQARLISDNTKWVLARRAASKYGDKITMDVNQTVDVSAALTEARNRIRDVSQTTIAQVRELTQVPISQATGSEPVVDGDATQNTCADEDIFT